MAMVYTRNTFTINIYIVGGEKIRTDFCVFNHLFHKEGDNRTAERAVGSTEMCCHRHVNSRSGIGREQEKNFQHKIQDAWNMA